MGTLLNLAKQAGDDMDIGYLVVIIGAVSSLTGIITFFITRQSAAKTVGEDFGRIKVILEHLTDDVKEIKSQSKLQNNQYIDLKTNIEVLKRDIKTAFSKIDEMKERR